MTQNHDNIQNARLESSAFLTDILALCAFVEKEHCHKNSSEAKDMMEHTLKQVYKGILRYAAQVQQMQNVNGGKKILESLSPVANHPLKQIEASIKAEEDKLCQWVRNNEHLQNQKKAEDMLARIDEFINLIKDLHRKFDLLNLPDAEGASFDSCQTQHDEECLPGTRTNLLEEVNCWASSQGPCMFWLNGMAGTGKSTISRTVAQTFKQRGQLGASFFFERGAGDRGNATRFFSTIIRQLLTTVPQLTHGVSEVINNDPDISKRSFREQFDKLLLQPLYNLNPGEHRIVRVLVLDALDECDGEGDIQLLLRLLPQIQHSTSVHFKIFLTSRPELPIRLGFGNIADHDHRDFMLHEINETVIRDDISLFLTAKFSDIRKEYSLRGRKLSSDWPGDDEIRKLTNMAVPLFIIAATLCRFIRERSPTKRLSAILDDPATTSASKLDATYLPILTQILNSHNVNDSQQQLREFQNIVGTIVLLASPLSVSSLASLLGLHEDDIYDHLDFLHSVLYVPSDSEAPVQMLHLSFREFLLSSKSQFWVDEGETHQRLTENCLDVMKRSLRRNICNLPSEGVQRTEIDTDSINESIPPELHYSCRYWIQHLAKCKDLITQIDSVFSFLQGHFLHWAEVMCILGYASETVQGIERLQSLIYSNASPELSEFLHDTRRFMMKYRQISDTTPLQLYCSGLIFAPSKSIVKNTFGTKMPEWLCRLPTVEEFWNAELQTLESHDDWVYSVTFSQDGRWLASGSRDHTIKLWDPTTGALQQTLEAQETISKLSFANDGPYLETNLGTFNIQSLYGMHTAIHAQVRIEVSILDKDWVALQGKKVLWLPPAYRPCCVATGDGKLVMGHASGRVSFFQFRH